MFCPQCRIEFVGWHGICPDCKALLVDKLPPEIESAEKSLPYQTLFELVNKNNGRVRFDLTATEVERQRKWGIPFLGYGYAWAKRFQGSSNGVLTNLITIETGRQKKWTFPFFGFGFAWEKRLQGDIAGNELTLTARKVTRRRKWDFPFLGYGFAWTEEMTGECGDELMAMLTVTEIRRRRSWGFPYFGYGYAWPKNACLELYNKVDNPVGFVR